MIKKTEIKNSSQLSVFSPLEEIASRKSIIIAIAVFASGCGTNMPIQKNGNTGEYVLNRDDKSPFGNLPSVKSAIRSDATIFCATMNKKFLESYSIDKDRAIGVWPESTLYFECVELGQETGAKIAQPRSKAEPQQNGSIYSDLIKLDELRKKGILTEAEFEAQKQKLLGGSQSK